MRSRAIGRLKVSVVGLGCNNFGGRIDAQQTAAVVDAAIEAGVDYFDTAEIYGGGLSEEFLGAALKGRRDRVHIATKWGLNASDGAQPANRAGVRTAIEGSLQRLGTDYVDHYQLHAPDPGTPIEETLGELAALVAEGKIREIGCSNFDAQQLDEAVKASGSISVAPFASVQNHYSLLTRDTEKNGVLDACRRHRIGFVPYFPLESGLLTGKYALGKPPPEGARLTPADGANTDATDSDKLAIVAAIGDWAASSGHTVLDAAMSWLIGNDVVSSVISGATKPEQVQANVEAASWDMTVDERGELEEILSGRVTQ